MSAKNREKRRANRARKAKDEARRRQGETQGPPVFDEALFHHRPTLRDVIDSAVTEVLHGIHHGHDGVSHTVTMLAGDDTLGPQVPGGRETVDRVVFDRLQSVIGAQWNRGWQPADLLRILTRNLGARHARLGGDLIAAQLRRYAPEAVDPLWFEHLRAADASVWWDADHAYFQRWGAAERQGREATLLHALEVLAAWTWLPNLPLLGPVPGAASRDATPPSPRRPAAGSTGQSSTTPDERMLSKIRALLAKAESTEYAEEAEALSAKAQQLMARHSIDEALLAASSGAAPDQPTGIRVGIDNPYESAKSTLLSEVAHANRCRTVWATSLGFSTVIGHQADLRGVEMLYTSLLVQATAAMLREGSKKDSYGRSTTRSFRQSFLTAYAIRIGQRLREATEEVTTEAARQTASVNLLPVLASREDEVRRAAEEMFPDATSHVTRVTNREGWASGTAAADQARLHTHAEVNG